MTSLWKVALVAMGTLCVVASNAPVAQARKTPTAGVGPSTARPGGPVFALPPGLSLKEPMLGYRESDCRIDKKTPPVHLGPPETPVLLCLAFFNATATPIRVRLPAGLVFISRNQTTQNGLLIQVETFEAPPGEFFVKLNLLCLNSGRNGSKPGDEFELGPVLADKDPAWELINALKDKSIDSTEGRAPSRMQAALWNITDGDGLTSVDRARIAALPPGR